ncbi:hypothetical protein BD410DRAFT_564785 [Rickenella mellea]|uniref:TBP-associated factor 12 n=1 Tax=Rickenella mellea TaxID=50990 RepID=A0A4Y7QEG7_9AGAM|nr:hypothetical protein BD410DRAFT_564785 [Rickenella mellea]
MATNGTSQPAGQQNQNLSSAQSMNIITALGQAFKSQTGEPIQNDKIASLLLANMGQLSELAKQGKLNHQQILQLKEFADRNKATTPFSAPPPGTAAGPSKANTPQTQQSVPPISTPAPVSAFKSSSPAPTLASNTGGGYPISQTLTTTNPGHVQWTSAQQGRPTLSGGIAAGRMSGTPSHIARSSDDSSMLGVNESSNRRKNSPNDQSMRRSIQDLVSSIDPNIKIEPEVEDLLLDIADEFIDSVTNFGCRLAKHRGGDTLEVRDLQLHLERNHNIRIPGFASDETRISISQSAIAPVAGGATGGGTAKKAAQTTHMTLRSQRLAQVAQAKKEAKLI